MNCCKITVLKTAVFDDLSGCCASVLTPCPCLREGQQFVAGFEKPEGFCDWAWNDLLRFVTALLTGGSFSRGTFEGWMKEEGTMIACCTDGLRPVVSKLERVEGDPA